MSYIKKYARQNSLSYQVEIYPKSTTKEELGKIIVFDDGTYSWYVNPSICYPEDWDVQYTQWGTENTLNKAKSKIESFLIL